MKGGRKMTEEIKKKFDKWEFNGANDELLLLEIERLRQMLEMASVDISKFINCSPNDYLHDLSTRDYYEDIKENE